MSGQVDLRDQPPAGVEMLSASYHGKAALIALVNKLSRRGDIRPLAGRPIWDQQHGAWLMPVLRLRPPTPRWIKIAWWSGGVLVALSAAGFLLGWLLTSLSSEALFALIMFALGALYALMRATRRPSVSVGVSVRVR